MFFLWERPFSSCSSKSSGLCNFFLSGDHLVELDRVDNDPCVIHWKLYRIQTFCMQNVGQCRNGDDEHKRVSFAVIFTITQSLEWWWHWLDLCYFLVLGPCQPWSATSGLVQPGPRRGLYSLNISLDLCISEAFWFHWSYTLFSRLLVLQAGLQFGCNLSCSQQKVFYNLFGSFMGTNGSKVKKKKKLRDKTRTVLTLIRPRSLTTILSCATSKDIWWHEEGLWVVFHNEQTDWNLNSITYNC